MSENLELKNSNGRNIQINCVRDGIIAGEDGSIKVDGQYLPYATDSKGWLIQIDDVYMFELFSLEKNNFIKNVLIISPEGVIAIYTEKNASNDNIKNWNYRILLESDECFYEIIKADIQEIKEPTLVASLLHLYINTEFNGNKEYTFDIV